MDHILKVLVTFFKVSRVKALLVKLFLVTK